MASSTKYRKLTYFTSNILSGELSGDSSGDIRVSCYLIKNMGRTIITSNQLKGREYIKGHWSIIGGGFCLNKKNMDC